MGFLFHVTVKRKPSQNTSEFASCYLPFSVFSKNVVSFGNGKLGEENCLAPAKIDIVKLMLHQITVLNYADQKQVLALLQSLVCHQSSL